MIIKCTQCKVEYDKFPYEIRNLKDINTYICKKCTFANTNEQRICPVCTKSFTVARRVKKQTCSRSCANTFFRSGESSNNWNPDQYRTTCFLHHKKECVVCGESKVLDVHHYDGNRKNNSVENLIPLCPTHHRYMHSPYAHEIESLVKKYIENNFKLRVAGNLVSDGVWGAD